MEQMMFPSLTCERHVYIQQNKQVNITILKQI